MAYRSAALLGRLGEACCWLPRCAGGLAEDRFEAEFESGLRAMLDQSGARPG
ncbi:MAG: hypothetical protein ACJ74U_00340 [Jatrophihabitantaceae bacterium]